MRKFAKDAFVLPSGVYILTAGLNHGTVRFLWRVAEFLSEEKTDRFNNNLGVYRDNSAENIPEKVGWRVM